MRRPVAALLVLLSGLVLVCAGCVSLPDTGDLEVGDDQQTSTQESGIPYDPRPPQPGEQAGEIVTHFLDAMQANPTTTAVARKFLSEEAQDSWHPERGMITYDDFTSPRGSSEVRVQLLGVHHLNGRGSWAGELPAKHQTLSFDMTVEDGEWRIDDPPDAMIVSDEYFEARYRQVSLYFLDPSANVVVPEPVFVPRSGQLASVLMRGLLLGPDPRLRGVVHSYIPDGLTLDLAPPVSADGVAEVSLRGNLATQLDPEISELIAVQVAWTLRQDPSVRRVRLTVNDTPLTVSGEATDFDVSIGGEYNPAGNDTAQELFGLRDGRLVAAVGGGETPVAGAFGARDYGATQVAVDLSATEVAAVTDDGTTLRRASLDHDPQVAPRVVLSGATDLLRPAWDLDGRLWVADRTLDGARFSYLVDGRIHPVRIPGLTGQRVTRFLVSRDGTRLLAVVRRAGGDVVLESRLRQNGGKVRGTRATLAHRDADEKVRIRDIAWFSPTEVVLVRGVSKGLSQVTTFSVDGSSAVQSGDVPVELVRDNVVALVGSPQVGAATLAIGRSHEIHRLGPDDDSDVPAEDLVSLGYIG